MVVTEELCRQGGRSLCAVMVLANAIGAVAVASYLFATLGPPEGQPSSLSVDLVGLAVVAAVVFPVGGWLSQRSFERACGWLTESREPTDLEREATLRQPLAQALVGFTLWLGVAAFYGVVLAVKADHTLLHQVGVVDGILLGGLVTSALLYLLLQRTYRPAIAVALDGRAARRPVGPTIRRRHLLAWGAGSGIPLLALLVAPVTHEADAPVPLEVVIAGLAAIGLIAGAVATMAVARSIADPLDDVRGALAAIEAGDLGVGVVVDDGGEIGQLQAGVNGMVTGLRERQRLHDLFGRHVGTEVARLALEQGTGLGGEQREASILFVDLVGSTAMAEVLPPGEVVATLNAFFDAVVRTVAAEGGWVNKFEGDGAMCVFGAPSTQPDHAARALRAAVTLDRELRNLAGVHPGLAAGIGMSTGTVVAGNVGNESRYEYTVIGGPVNEAARLTELAKRRTVPVLASAATVAAAGVVDGWADVGQVALRGRQEPTHLYEPVASDVATA